MENLKIYDFRKCLLNAYQTEVDVLKILIETNPDNGYPIFFMDKESAKKLKVVLDAFLSEQANG